MKLSATQALHAYWASRCQGRRTPDRQDLDPVEMRSMLPFTFMLEADGDAGTYPIRISGTRLDALFGRSLKGEAFSNLWNGADFIDMRFMLAGVLDGAQPAVAAFRGAPAGETATIFELLALPLRHHGQTHARLLCSLVPTKTPSWLGLSFVERLTLGSWRFVDRLEAAPAIRTGTLRREHLVVYDGGRAEEPTTPSVSQSRVKALVARSRDTLLSTRRS